MVIYNVACQGTGSCLLSPFYMRELIEKLLILQHCDQKNRDVLHSLQQLPQEKSTCESDLKKSDYQLELARARQRENEIELKKLEVDILSKQEQIFRYRRQQLETRKNDEYAALNHEIAVGEKNISAIEDAQLVLMELAETLYAQLQSAQQAHQLEQTRINNVLGSLDLRRANLFARQEELAKERLRLIDGIDEDLLERYGRLFKSKNGTAIVPVEHHTCTGCHMQVPMQIILAAKAAKELVLCLQCGRVLYCEEE
ncbi:MAG: zinc ribbon domain-containing protein [Chthoniobacterales bacterium]